MKLYKNPCSSYNLQFYFILQTVLKKWKFQLFYALFKFLYFFFKQSHIWYSLNIMLFYVIMSIIFIFSSHILIIENFFTSKYFSSTVENRMLQNCLEKFAEFFWVFDFLEFFLRGNIKLKFWISINFHQLQEFSKISTN